MRVIESDDLESAAPRLPPPANVILGIDDKPRRILRRVARSHRLDDDVAVTDQQTAALCRRGLTRVRDNIGDD